MQVRSLIEGQRQLNPNRKILVVSGSSANMHSDQIKAGLASSSSLAAAAEPPSKPRVSEGAISIEAKQGKSMDGRSGPGEGSRPSSEQLLDSAGLPNVTIIASAATPEKGAHSCHRGYCVASPLGHTQARYHTMSVLPHPRSLSHLLHICKWYCIWTCVHVPPCRSRAQTYDERGAQDSHNPLLWPI